MRYDVTWPLPTLLSILEKAETEPTWNFFKYLVDAEGQVWGAWGPHRSAQSISPYIVQAVEQTYKHSKPTADEL